MGSQSFRRFMNDKRQYKPLSDHTVIQHPDCLFRRIAQNAFCVMAANVKLDYRMPIQYTGDRLSKWNSVRSSAFLGAGEDETDHDNV